MTESFLGALLDYLLLCALLAAGGPHQKSAAGICAWATHRGNSRGPGNISCRTSTRMLPMATAMAS